MPVKAKKIKILNVLHDIDAAALNGQEADYYARSADVGDVDDLETTATDLVEAVNEVNDKADENATSIATALANMSDEFSTSKTYKVGQLCIKDDKLYRCTTAITTAEAWNSSHWTETTIAEEIENRCLFFTGVTVSATTGTILSKSDSRITADHVLANIVFANSSAINGSATWTTSAGSMEITGTCITATTADILLVKMNN